MPFILWFCYSRDLRIALPTVYGVTGLTIIIATLLSSPIVAAMLGWMVLGLTSTALVWFMPKTIRRVHDGTCGWCGYDVAGGDAVRCPECGRECDPSVSGLTNDSTGQVLGEITLSQLVKRKVGTWSSILLAIFVFTLAISRYVGPHFSVARYHRVDVGWTEAEVRRLLGRPDKESQNSAIENTWTWEVPHLLFPDTYEIYIEDGIVKKTNFFPG